VPLFPDIRHEFSGRDPEAMRDRENCISTEAEILQRVKSPAIS